jgi:hypothetical protein
LSFGVPGCSEESGPQIFRIGLVDSDGGEHARLVAATRVLGIQAIVQQLPDIYNGVFAIG